MSNLDDVIETISKEVIDEKANITLNLLVILSAFTSNPLNLRNLSPPGYGKTHGIKKIIQYFPAHSIIDLSSATAKSFKYHGVRMVEVEPGKFVDFQEQMDAAQAISDESEREEEIKWIKKHQWLVFDFTGKTLIFGDSQTFALWEELKQIASHDSKITKSYGVNKSSSGSLFGQKFATIGYPAIIYNSAKDEVAKDPTNEIGSRFITTSIKSNEEKNKKRHEITALKYGLPNKLSKIKLKLSDEEIESTKSKVIQLIDEVKNSEAINLLSEIIAKLLNNDLPNDRELKNLLSNINILTCANAPNRYILVNEEDAFVLSSLSDVNNGAALTKRPISLPISKIQFLNTKIKPLLVEQNLKAAEIADALGMVKKHLWENYLKPFLNYGYLESSGDKYSGYYLSLANQYKTKDATEESPLIDTTSLDFSCVKSTLEWWIENGYHIETYDGQLASLEDYITNKGESTTKSTQNVPESNSVKVSKGDENWFLHILEGNGK